MHNSQLLSPVEMLSRVAVKAFPARLDIGTLNIKGTYEQAWQLICQLLNADEAELARKLAEETGIEYVEYLDNVEPSAINMVPFAFCQINGILPLRFDNRKLMVATANPFDSNIAEKINYLTGKASSWLIASPGAIRSATLETFAMEGKRKATSDPLLQAMTSSATPEETVGSEIIRLAANLLTSAVRERASDLHIQPYLGSGMVRIRVDGELRQLMTLPDAVTITVIRYFKAKGGMESTNSIIPQDGRTSITVDGRSFDLRISSLPVSKGERLVIRFLDQSRVYRLGKTGFSTAALQTMRRLISQPSGLIILTGPTGSGKTSTLYSMIAELNSSSTCIITVENPVEYEIPGISQVEVNEKSGRSFAAALRSILRQDPDVVLIGEIRDKETAEIATQAAMTGHLVLSTLHTNDAITSIPRLLGLGLIPVIVADSLTAIISQRLCRRLCANCKVLVQEPYTNEEKAFFEATRHYPSHRPAGCEQCSGTGYHGRLPIIDIIEVGQQLRDLIARNETRISLLEEAREGGLKSLAVSGSFKVISGDTTVSEVLGSVGNTFWRELAEHYGTQLDDEASNLAAHALVEEPGVLLISGDIELTRAVETAIQTDGYRLFVAADPVGAAVILRQEEGVIFVIMDFEDDLPLEAALESRRAAGQALYWSRLPALVLFPPHLATHEELFRENGMMSPCLTKPFSIADLLLQLRRSQAR